MVTRITRCLDVKICSKCKIQQPPTNEFFTKNPRSKDKLDYSCKQCHKKYRMMFLSMNPEKRLERNLSEKLKRRKTKDVVNKKRREKYSSDEEYRQTRKNFKIKYREKNPIHWYAMETIRGHKKNGNIIDISVSELEDLCRNTNQCMICDVNINWDTLKSKTSPSLDRINNENVLNIDNIQLLCLRCNMVKGDMTMKQFIEYCSQVANKFLCNVKEVKRYGN